ncbi:hypothetical protein O1611_g3269 [Lasiodiplodia mahajangana]|uniref:Uncharacterized protein n=1 Tax=Lasiodiplodia mahajangana TaxID=1108764 RepID=A0ACC2JSA1_9PEZI|nr:hypothetical protein O1611_g3269 [Lasiodiplodia mahajangana]
MAYPPDYEKVVQSVDEASQQGFDHHYRPQPRSHLRSALLSGLAATVTFIIGLSVGSSAGFMSNNDSGAPNGGALAVQGPFTETSQCGHTPAEARALGCSYDLLSATWWPAACEDQSTAKEFEEWLRSPKRLRPWPFYLDQNGTQHLETLEELSEMAGKDIWTTQEFHTGHCMLWWKRLHKSMEGRIATNIWAGEYHHTAHCSNTLLTTDWSTVGEIVAKVPSGGGYGWCRQPIKSGNDLKS